MKNNDCEKNKIRRNSSITGQSRTMAIMFMVYIVCPFVLFPIFKPLVNNVDYGKRNATYTYFYQNEYVDTAFGAPENLVDFPSINPKNFRKFPSEFESWLNARLPFKKLLVKLNSEINYHLFHQMTNSHVVVGKEGWLFYDEAVDESVGKWTFKDVELQLIAEKMQHTKDILDSQGKRFVIFIAPNKESVYSEYLPKYDKIRAENTAVNQLIEYLQCNTNVDVIYPLEELIQAKDDYPDVEFYHRIDTHWNCAGAYIGAKALAKSLGKELPDFSEVKKEVYEFTSSDLTNLMGMPIKEGTKDYSIYGYGEDTTILDQWDYYSLIKYHNDEENDKLIVFRDSFSTAMSQHLSVNFNQSIYPLYDTDKQQIYEYDADIVVYEIVERDIKKLWDMGLE